MTFDRRKFLVATVASALAPQFASASDKLNIVATTGMIADTARQIGGNHVEVQALMGPGVDPHAYRQTRSDIAAMTRTDLVLWHGLYLEAQMEEFLVKLGRRRASIPVAEAMPRESLISHADYDGRFDPHVWMVPNLWREVAHSIAKAMSDARPALAKTFTANLARFEAELDALQAYGETTLATVPEAARVLLTAHDAFGYFGREFGYEVIGIQGISTESEAGLNRISSLVDMLVERKIAAAFVESSVSDRNIRALIEGAAAQNHTVAIGGELFSDAMGEDGTYEASYIGMIDHNITTIARALGGKTPERGLNGNLAVGS
ncbi:metal ABC transporter solute-binding protein, Zn/Mn family [Planktotalea sp.]|uniref:metal ABC transporter solute-binding protein, Zn/Mn family n=1 Tax=Planktotalea sp. TaxID=2029877 RepID=UPI003D6B1772